MKNIIILIAVFMSINSQAQNVSWVPSSEGDGGCSMVTDCKTNTLCYSLQYTPDATGRMTSYTTGFFTSCIEGNANLLHNKSCVINDNSSMISACEDHNLTLLNCSGNTGQLQVNEGEAVILHQVCFDIDVNEEIVLEEDPVMGITVSIDTEEGFKTSLPKYNEHKLSTRSVNSPCDQDLFEGEVDVFDGLELDVYPIPSSGIVNVLFDDGGSTADMSILSSENKRMLTQNITCNKEYTFNLNHYHAGTYIVHVKGENETESKKFIIIK